VSEAGSWHQEGSARAQLRPEFPLLVGEREHRLYTFEPSQVSHVQSCGNYVMLHVGAVQYVNRGSLKRLEQMLDGHGFLRIHRSFIVNIRSVLYAERQGRGAFKFKLKSGECLKSSAYFRNQIVDLLGVAHPSHGRSAL
jgi:two-component system LytT family response regulator